MKKYFFILILLANVLLAFSESLTEYEKNILDFKIQGIKLGDSFEKVKNQFPEANIKPSYICIENELIDNEYLEFINFYFIDNMLVNITLVYKNFNWSSIIDAFVAKYGQYTENDDSIYLSKRYQRIKRGYVIYYADGFDNLHISIIDTDFIKSDSKRDILDFNIKGIKIGDSIEKVKSLFPNLEDCGDRLYCNLHEDNIETVFFCFYNKVLVEISFLYEQNFKFGGEAIIAENFMEKYGRFESAVGTQMYREFKKINREYSFSMFPPTGTRYYQCAFRMIYPELDFGF